MKNLLKDLPPSPKPWGVNNDKISVDMVEIIKVLSPDLLVLDNPINPITQGLGFQFDKVDLKCTLTFKIFN